MNCIMRYRLVLSLLVAFVAANVHPAFAVTVNQVDTFQTGTKLDWAGSAAPANIPTGGREGATDGYLQISSISGHLATFNQSQWIGDYATAGIDAIELDMNHFSGDPVSIRLYVFGGGGSFASTVAKPIADSTWKRYQFGLAATDLTDLDGVGNLTATLAAVNKILIRYNVAEAPTPTGQQADITAVLGIDNIRAIIYGDVNYDGLVNIFDINLVSSDWNEAGPTGDANADGVVNIFDINLISANWTPSQATSVPEPATLILASLGLLGLFAVKRRVRG